MPSYRIYGGLAAAACALAPACVHAQDRTRSDEILVTAKYQRTIENPPASRATVDAESIGETVNAVNVEDTLKYLPSLVVRKRHIGDTQAPLATRTSGLGASARSLIFANGALLSALVGNNNTTASPRWGIVSTEEIERIDVLYGPFSAAYPGNSIGAVVNITTRLPETFEATLNAGTNAQQFDLYGTRRTLPSYQLGGTVGDRIGPLSLFASADHVDSRSQPIGIVSATSGGGGGAATAGGYDDRNRLGQPIRVFGASAFEHQVQDRFKLKAALDLSSDVRLTYVGSVFLGDTEAASETYLHGAATGAPVYAGSFANAGKPYALAASAFSNGVYHGEQRHWSHSVSLGGSGERFDWQLIGTLYDFAKDLQRVPTVALPAAASGGAGNITLLDGTGWKTLDAKGSWRTGTHTLALGGHGDWFTLLSRRYTLPTDWIHDAPGALNLQSSGKTHTYAVWAQDAWRIVPALTLTVGGRYEWWKAYRGLLSQLPVPAQPERSATGFSPKAALAWDATPSLRARLSFGQAWRFPTAGELFQVVTTPTPVAPNPNLRPERARSAELAIERHDSHGTVRLSLFDEVVRDALISQIGPLPTVPPATGTFVQNVDETRARGVELAVVRANLVRRVDVSGSVTYADAITSRDVAFSAAVGKLLPSVPRWKATAVVTWRPDDAVSLTAAARYASRNYGSLDNSDVVGNTYQGFYRYFVVDLRAQFKASDRIEFGLGVDNLNNDKYFLFHPFPQRSFAADVKVRL